jgi:hypothetical protein
VSATVARTGFLRFSRWDGILVGLSLAYGAALLLMPSIPLIAIGLWWMSNTVAHNFIHTPFFRSARLNTVYSVFLSALTGIPQTLWRRRHLDHHAGRACRRDRNGLLAMETGVVAVLWAGLALAASDVFLRIYLPGYAAGLGLCFLQGHYEHARGTTSHYGRVYNLCFFNDGYHVEHHAKPGVHWTRLPGAGEATGRRSRWPPVLRWLDALSLEGLERLVMKSPPLQRFVLARHERALGRLLADLPRVADVTIVGGGLFPRTLLILRQLLPEASLTIVEQRAEHIAAAQAFLERCRVADDGRVRFAERTFDPATEAPAELLIIPLAYDGDRGALYSAPTARFTLIHDWMWNRRPAGVLISWLLLKRLNLVTR